VNDLGAVVAGAFRASIQHRVRRRRRRFSKGATLPRDGNWQDLLDGLSFGMKLKLRCMAGFPAGSRRPLPVICSISALAQEG